MKGVQTCQHRSTAITSSTSTSTDLPYGYALAVGGTDGVVAQLRAIVAELDLLMAIDGFPTLADLRAAGAQRI
jgi:lactate 2-monooxygenase